MVTTPAHLASLTEEGLLLDPLPAVEAIMEEVPALEEAAVAVSLHTCHTLYFRGSGKSPHMSHIVLGFNITLFRAKLD